MGTSLSGLTPATTFDGLLKTSDNEPLDGTLKAISTGEGTDTMLELSTSALQIGGATGMYWDNTNKRLGINNTSPAAHLEVNGEIRSTSLIRLMIGGSNKVLMQNANTIINSDVAIGQATAPTSRLHVKGSGATSATTSLLVQNSAGTQALKVTDDGIVTLGNSNVYVEGADIKRGTTALNLTTSPSLTSYDSQKFKTFDGTNYTEVMRITNTDQFVGIGETTPTARLHVKGSGADATTTSLLVEKSDATQLLKIRDDGNIFFGPGSNNYLQNGYNLFGNYNAIGSWNIGTASAMGARVGIKGTGATSATTALLVQNSAGTDLLKVTDDGILDLGDAGARGEITLGRSSDGAQMGNIFANTNGLAIRGNGNFNTIMVGRNTNEGITINNATTYLGASLGVKGFGATSATTALLVQNSAGSDLLKVADDGGINFNGNIFADADYKQIGRNSSNSIRFANGEARLAVQGTSAGNKFHVYSSSTATTVFSVYTQTQQVGIGNGNTALDASAKLQVDSTTQGFLPPRMTTTQRDAISSPASGLMVYNTTTNKAQCYNGTAWQDLF